MPSGVLGTINLILWKQSSSETRVNSSRLVKNAQEVGATRVVKHNMPVERLLLHFKGTGSGGAVGSKIVAFDGKARNAADTAGANRPFLMLPPN
jgi:hypothetical protein